MVTEFICFINALFLSAVNIVIVAVRMVATGAALVIQRLAAGFNSKSVR